jgi:hypothetical protein
MEFSANRELLRLVEASWEDRLRKDTTERDQLLTSVFGLEVVGHRAIKVKIF